MGIVIEKLQDPLSIRIEIYRLRVKYGDPITGNPLAPSEYGKRRFDWKRTEVNNDYCNRTVATGNLDKKQTSLVEENHEVGRNEKTPPKRRISKERILFAGLFTLLDLLDPFIAVYLMG